MGRARPQEAAVSLTRSTLHVFAEVSSEPLSSRSDVPTLLTIPSDTRSTLPAYAAVTRHSARGVTCPHFRPRPSPSGPSYCCPLCGGRSWTPGVRARGSDEPAGVCSGEGGKGRQGRNVGSVLRDRIRPLPAAESPAAALLIAPSPALSCPYSPPSSRPALPSLLPPYSLLLLPPGAMHSGRSQCTRRCSRYNSAAPGAAGIQRMTVPYINKQARGGAWRQHRAGALPCPGRRSLPRWSTQTVVVWLITVPCPPR